MTNFTLHSCPDAPTLASTVAQDWLSECQESISRQNLICVALSGGRLAPRLFSALANTPVASRPFTEKLHFFWADERCVPPDDPESNFSLARDHLFLPWEISPTQIHRVAGEMPPSQAALQAREELKRWAPSNPEGLPVLDTIFLGMGEDGHIASLFPGRDFRGSQPPDVYKAVRGPKPPFERITLDMPTLVAARSVWIVISGAGKESILRQSLAQPSSTPLGWLLRQRHRSEIYVDFPLE